MNKIFHVIFTRKTLTRLINKTTFLLFLIGASFLGYAQQPAGFQDNVYVNGFDGVNGITFDEAGRAYVWEKVGRLHCRTLDGIWRQLLDISDEVNTATDSGLKGVALHPNFLTNGYIYLLYEVDRHHLMNFGTSSYNPLADEHLNASISRITRYTVNTLNFDSIFPNSRFVLLGNSPTDGFPFIHDSHNAGSLIFGTDGTLLASCGESSATNADPGSDTTTYYAQALNDGILKSDDPLTTSINENENVGSWRTQMKNCLSGKIIRIDPLTGNGISTNPFYDAANPRAAKSRVWAMGLRNPFRMTLKPNTGEHLPSAGNPGTIYVGEVGSTRKEEVNVVKTGGQNFGWPRFEGMEKTINPIVNVPFNRDEFYLSVDSTNHIRPIIDFRQSPARAYVQSTIREIGTGASNEVPGINFVGGCSIGGVFYEGTNFPSAYKGRYFHGNFSNGEDPTKNWIHSFTTNNNDELSESHSFLTNALGVTGMAINPVNGYLYYASYGGSIREVKYDLGNQPPMAKATQDKKFGVSPLTVQLNGSQSTDPESGVLTYLWNFGDGSTSTSVNPTHVFTAPNSDPIRYDVILTVTDNQSQTNSVSLIVSVNNTPPVINSTTVDNLNIYANTSNEIIALQANVTDSQTLTSQLAFKWETSLHHDTHFHPNPVNTQQNSSFTMTPLPCDNEVYFYQVKLTVTDAHGLSTVKTKNILPNCAQNTGDTQPPSTPTNLQLTNLNTSRISFSWTPSTDNVGVATYEIFKDSVKIDESLSSNYTAIGLQPATFYLFKVTAKDIAGNISSKSSGLGVYTDSLVTKDEIIYGDALNGNWQISSPSSSITINNSVYPIINNRSIKINSLVNGHSIILTHNGFPIETASYPFGIEFWVYNAGNTTYPFQLQAFATTSGNGGSTLGLSADANKWTHFLLDWAILGNLTQISKVAFTLNQTQSQSLYFDEIKLVYCSQMYSVRTGNWNQNTTWSCGRIPISTDDITISGGNTVTIPNGVSATLKFLELIGTLKIQTGAIFNIKKY